MNYPPKIKFSEKIKKTTIEKIPKSKEKNALIWSVGSIIIPVIFAYIETDRYSRIEYIVALIFSMSVYIVTIQYNRHIALTNAEKNIENLNILQSNLVNILTSSISIYNKIGDLLNQEGSLRSTGLNALDKMMESISFEKKGLIEIKGRDISFYSYLNFWEEMLLLQSCEYLRNSNENPQNLIALITHATELSSWKEGNSFALRHVSDIHRNFINKNGKIFRIFLDFKNNGNSIKNFISIMKEMRSIKIECVYINENISRNITSSDFEYDFCLIYPGLYASEWHADVTHRVISCNFSSDLKNRNRNMRKWTKYLEDIYSINYESIPKIQPEDVIILNEYRASFIKSWNDSPSDLKKNAEVNSQFSDN